MIKNDKGFTLLEVAVSLAIIAVALVAVFRLQAQNLDLQSEAYFITAAKHLAQDRIARIRSQGALSEGIDRGDCGEDFPQFLYQSEIRKIQEEPLYSLKVSIFQEHNGFVKDLSVETVLFR